MQELIKKVEHWVIEKGIKDKATALTQLDKMYEEVDELGKEIESLELYGFFDNKKEALMELGDVVVTCIAMSMLLETDIQTVLQMAYDKISKRKGKMINGTFVKEEDYK